MRQHQQHILTGLLLVFLLADTSYSFLQYFYQPLDGDMAWNLVPAEEVKNILADPFGLGPLLTGTNYPNPNRFFSHWIYREYLLRAPLFLQSWWPPISSVYLACALAKLFVHLWLVYLLTRAVLGPKRRSWRPYLWVSCLLVPCFQSAYYGDFMGIVDSVTSYTFFYALPTAFLLVFILPFLDRFVHGRRERLSVGYFILLVALAVVVSLSGPLNPGIVLVALVTCGGLFLWKRPFPVSTLGRQHLFLGVFIGLCSLYSLYLGRYNSLTLATQLPLTEVYAKLPEGILRQFTTKWAFPLLFLAIGINYYLLRRGGMREEYKRLFTFLFLFSAGYILLLPLGGYRWYRDGVVRYDTMLPITLLLVGAYAASTEYLLRQLKGQSLIRYLLLPLVFTLIFTGADEFEPGTYYCERAALEEIARSPADVVPLATDCPVALWEKYPDPMWSELNGRLFARWRITDQPKQYFHPP